MKLEFYWQISSFIKIRLVGDELFHMCGRTDMMKLIVALRNSVNAPKNEMGKTNTRRREEKTYQKETEDVNFSILWRNFNTKYSRLQHFNYGF